MPLIIPTAEERRRLAALSPQVTAPPTRAVPSPVPVKNRIPAPPPGVRLSGTAAEGTGAGRKDVQARNPIPQPVAVGAQRGGSAGIGTGAGRRAAAAEPPRYEIKDLRFEIGNEPKNLNTHILNLKSRGEAALTPYETIKRDLDAMQAGSFGLNPIQLPRTAYGMFPVQDSVNALRDFKGYDDAF